MARSIAQLKEAAAAALSHKMFARLLKEHVPPGHRDNPRELLAWLEAAGGLDQKGASRPEFIKANHALRELVKAEAVERQYAEVYHDQELHQLAGSRWDELTSDPAKAYEAAMSLMSTNPKAYASPAVQRAVSFLAETRHEGYWAAPAADDVGPVDPVEQPVAPNAKAQLAAAFDLAQTDAAAYRSPEHQERLAALANGQPAPRPPSGAKAELDRLMGVMKTDYATYKSPEFQARLGEVALAAKAERAAVPAAPSAAPTPQPSSQGGGIE